MSCFILHAIISNARPYHHTGLYQPLPNYHSLQPALSHTAASRILVAQCLQRCHFARPAAVLDCSFRRLYHVVCFLHAPFQPPSYLPTIYGKLDNASTKQYLDYMAAILSQLYERY